MSKKIENLLSTLRAEVAELKEIVAQQGEQISSLKSQLDSVSMVKIEEDGVKRCESFGNLILDEMVSIKNKLEIITSIECNAKINEQVSNEFSLNELKKELIRLADMMNA